MGAVFSSRGSRPPDPHWTRPPLLRPSGTARATAPFRCLFRLAWGYALLLLLLTLTLALSPLLLLVLLVRAVRRRRDEPRQCDACWPFSSPDEPTRAVVALNKHVDPGLLSIQLSRILASSSVDCCLAGHSESSCASVDMCTPWDQSQHPLTTMQQLMRALNGGSAQLASPRRIKGSDGKGRDAPAMAVKVADRVETTSDGGKSPSPPVCLVIFSLRPHRLSLCVPRLLALSSIAPEAGMEMHPHISPSYPLLPPPFDRLKLFVHAAADANRVAKSLLMGPSRLLSAFLRRAPDPMWTHVKRRGEYRNRSNRRPACMRVAADDCSSVLMDSIADEVAVEEGRVEGKTANATPSPSSPTRCLVWLSVPQLDQLTRAERLMRASSVQMAVALAAGALRQHLREQGLAHPSDLSASLSCSRLPLHQPAAAAAPCDTVTLPMRLPTGVEGSIPRIWAVQRRMEQAAGGYMPAVIHTTKRIATALLSPHCARRLCAAGYGGDHSVHIQHYTVHGQLTMDEHLIRSLLLFPSMPAHIPACLSFVHMQGQLLLCASLDRRAFPHGDRFVALVKSEVSSLLSHLSVRLMTLQQSTILPRHTVDEWVRGGGRGSAMSDPPSPSDRPDDDYSLGELQQLLSTVQEELDEMRSKPQGNRGEYIRKLAELEERMQRFHACITQKLGAEPVELPEVEGNALEDLLAPYKQTAPAPRRFSREFARQDSESGRKTSRPSLQA